LVTVTKRAKRQLKEVLAQRGLDPGKFLRLAVPPAWTGDGDFGIVIDDRGVMDETVTLDGVTILLIEEMVTEQLAKAVLDFKTPTEGPRFTLDLF
jgi:Fe-S cluster assembly iron-binding protein IscA